MSRWRIAISMLLLATAAGGCGADEAPVAAAPKACVESWNDVPRSQRFGRHAYDAHESAQAEVARLEPLDPGSIVDERGACAVIFAVPEWDAEYGAVGLVMTPLGWASMEELGRDDPAELERIQEAAAAGANATLFPDGGLEAD